MIDFQLEVKGNKERASFAVCGLGKKTLIIGEKWLKQHNPTIDWTSGKLEFDRCPSSCGHKMQVIDEEEERIFTVMTQEINGVAQDLANEEEKKKQKKKFEETVPTSYHNCRKVFDKGSFDNLPPRRIWDHAIELKPDAKPHVGKVYPLSRNEQEQLEVFLNENLSTGRIRSSKSPMASPFFFIKKKSGELRPVQDYRKLNDMTIRNSYPLPLISELIDKLKGAKIFTKLDIRWGYNNVRIKEGDEWKAAFITNRGLFEPLVMFFGLTNSPATFQTMMNHLFKELVAKGAVVFYMDNILIFTDTLEAHCRIVQEVLQILADNNRYLKPEKCDFEKEEIDYLGLKVSFDKIMMDPVKVAGIKDWPTPRTVTEVRSFIGFCNFYRRFIRDFSKISQPLHNLMA